MIGSLGRADPIARRGDGRGHHGRAEPDSQRAFGSGCPGNGATDGFRGVAETEKLVRPNVGRMQETLRYLRTFRSRPRLPAPVSLIFAGFAEEILQRIQEGADQVNAFSDKLKKLSTDLGPVMIKGEATVTRYKETIPQIVQNSSTGVDRIKGERRQLAQRADEVKAIARGIQNKLSSTLSAMQIGDITRQRIEHCQYSFEVSVGLSRSPEGLTECP